MANGQSDFLNTRSSLLFARVLRENQSHGMDFEVIWSDQSIAAAVEKLINALNA